MQDLHALATTVRKLTAINDPRLLAVRTCAAVAELTDFGCVALALVDEPGLMRVVASSGFSRSLVGQTVSEGDGLGGNALKAGESLLVDDEVAIDTNTLLGGPRADPVFGRLLPPDTRYEGFLSETTAAVAQPVIHAGTVVGMIYAGYTGGQSHEHGPLAMLSEFSAFLAPLLVSVTHIGQREQTARAEERQQVVQQLHDTSLQLLFGIRLSAQSLLQDDLSPHVREKIGEIESSALNASRFLRETIRETLGAQRNLVVTVQRFVEAFSARSAIPAQLIVLGEPRSHQDEVERAILTAVREFLHNIEKHAHASTAAVSLTYRDDMLVGVVQDDGVGVPDDFRPPVIPNASCGLGLVNVAQSVALLGGSVTWERNEDGGTTARISVPTNPTVRQDVLVADAHELPETPCVCGFAREARDDRVRALIRDGPGA
ncbi:sensor histidine kinase [Streptomyces sp. NBC_01803]|uniref:sensor histidine kinase n=1 Tax=Streptomyces sp. NBC_01803 TaxID=2975946 RepID=UPI002DDBEC52|nr:ATP-binding protein [Streptomyces sp. NBC_01803]WSA42952.1 ATP-binding protein [Streptomyces sp. NBC_01803]